MLDPVQSLRVEENKVMRATLYKNNNIGSQITLAAPIANLY